MQLLAIQYLYTLHQGVLETANPVTQNVFDSEIPFGDHTVDFYILGRDVHAILSREELVASNCICLLQAVHDNSQFVRSHFRNFSDVRKIFCQVLADLKNIQWLFNWPEKNYERTASGIWVSFCPYRDLRYGARYRERYRGRQGELQGEISISSPFVSTSRNSSIWVLSIFAGAFSSTARKI